MTTTPLSDTGPVRVDDRNAETPMGALRGGPTPARSFFVRSNFDLPVRDPARPWEIQLSGAGIGPQTLTVSQLIDFPSQPREVVMECAGNGRAFQLPTPPGTLWQWGAAGWGRFSGVPLEIILKEATTGPLDPDLRVVFTGADSGEVESGGVQPFARAIPLSELLEVGAFLALRMDGAPLPAAHGGPVRLVVPRSYAVNSVKWLRFIHLQREPFRGFFQEQRYRYFQEEGVEEGAPVGRIRVRSLMGSPQEGELLPPGPLRLEGVAWTGTGTITQVEVSADRGESWIEARLKPRGAAAVAWSVSLPALPAGPHTLLSRATDSAGNRQPIAPRWNALGYGNNQVQGVEVTVTEARKPILRDPAPPDA